MPVVLSARNLKCTVVLEPAAVRNIALPGETRFPLSIAVAGRTVTASVTWKSVRKAQVLIDSLGVDRVAIILQGNLQPDDTLADASLQAVERKPKPEAAPAAPPAAA